MAQKAYRRAGRQTGLWVACILLGVLGQVAMVPLLQHLRGARPDVWNVVLGILPLPAMLVVAALASRGRDRRRRARIMALLQAAGYRCRFSPTAEERQAYLAPLRRLVSGLDLRDSPAGLQWIADRALGGGQALLFEFEFVTGSGKSSQLHRRTVVALSAEVAALGRLPGFVAARLPWLERRALRQVAPPDEALRAIAPGWSMVGDAASGARLFNPAAQADLARAPRGESWCIGGGWACCAFRDALDAGNLAAFLARAQRVLAPGVATASGPPAERPGAPAAVFG